jgi:hypothetical protein
MPTRLLILTLLISLGMVTTASARLGETESAVEARYGTPHFRLIKSWSEDVTYEANGFTILVTFIKGVSKGEKFTLPGQTISDQQVSDLLEANSEGFLWDEVAKADLVPPAKKMWKKPNGSTAVLTGSSFEFKSIDLINAQADEDKAKAKPAAPSTQGF